MILKTVLSVLLLGLVTAQKTNYIELYVCKCNGFLMPCSKCQEEPREGENCVLKKNYGPFNPGFSNDKQLCIQNNSFYAFCYETDSICSIAPEREKNGENLSPDVKSKCDYLNPIISAKLSLDAYERNISKFPKIDKSSEMKVIHEMTGCNFSLFQEIPFTFSKFTYIYVYAFTSKDDFSSDPEGYIISIKGTSFNSISDLANDVQIFFNQTPTLYTKSKEILDEFFKKNDKIRNKVVNIVGHSLGGAVSQLLAIGYKYHSTSFDAPGVFRLTQNLGLNPYDGVVQIYTSLPHWVNVFGDNKRKSVLLLIDPSDDCNIYNLGNALIIDEYSTLPQDFPVTDQQLFQNYFTFHWNYLNYYHKMKGIYQHIKDKKDLIIVENMNDLKALNCRLYNSGYTKKFYEKVMKCFKPKSQNFLEIVNTLNSKSC